MAADHYNYFSTLIKGVEQASDYQKIATAGLVAILLLCFGALATRKIRAAGKIDDRILVPEERINLFGFFDMLIEGFIKFHDSVLGKERRKYVSFSATVFFLLFFSNILGLVPGFPAATTTVWVNVAVAIVVFIYFNYLGIKEHGLGNYILHFCGPAASYKEKGFSAVKLILWSVAFLIFPVEIISTIARVLTLNLRLYWNITADHLVLGVFTDLTSGVQFLSPIVLLPFYALGTIVSFMQSFVYTVLTMIYILLAVQHQEEH
ncbi:MAG: F0F1 ATP synthase subunit A [Candidatus Dadabacteria bacterium]|nr:MAG: F0F1 ATP synthase subunit A [Candidatus Dadabacteria bacterium]